MGVGSWKKARLCLRCDFGTLSDFGETPTDERLQRSIREQEQRAQRLELLPGRRRLRVNSLHRDLQTQLGCLVATSTDGVGLSITENGPGTLSVELGERGKKKGRRTEGMKAAMKEGIKKGEWEGGK